MMAEGNEVSLGMKEDPLHMISISFPWNERISFPYDINSIGRI
jgi:hypothetical protein